MHVIALPLDSSNLEIAGLSSIDNLLYICTSFPTLKSPNGIEIWRGNSLVPKSWRLVTKLPDVQVLERCCLSLHDDKIAALARSFEHLEHLYLVEVELKTLTVSQQILNQDYTEIGQTKKYDWVFYKWSSNMEGAGWGHFQSISGDLSTNSPIVVASLVDQKPANYCISPETLLFSSNYGQALFLCDLNQNEILWQKVAFNGPLYPPFKHIFPAADDRRMLVLTQDLSKKVSIWEFKTESFAETVIFASFVPDFFSGIRATICGNKYFEYYNNNLITCYFRNPPTLKELALISVQKAFGSSLKKIINYINETIYGWTGGISTSEFREYFGYVRKDDVFGYAEK